MNDMVQNKLESFGEDWKGSKKAIELMDFQPRKQLCKITEVRVQDNKHDDNSVWVICKVYGAEEPNEEGTSNSSAEQDKFFYLGRDKVKNKDLINFLEMFNIDAENMNPAEIEGVMDAVKYRVFWADVQVTAKGGERRAWITPTSVTDDVAGQSGPAPF